MEQSTQHKAAEVSEVLGPDLFGRRVFDKKWDEVCSHLGWSCKDQALIEDVAQDAFVCVWPKILEREVEGGPPITLAYLKGVARNLLRNARRKKRVLTESELGDGVRIVEGLESREPSPLEAAASAEERARIVAFLESLSHLGGRIVIMKDFGGIPMAGICTDLHISQSWAYKLYAQALAELVVEFSDSLEW